MSLSPDYEYEGINDHLYHVESVDAEQYQLAHDDVVQMTTAQQHHAFHMNQELDALDMEIMGEEKFNSITSDNIHGHVHDQDVAAGQDQWGMTEDEGIMQEGYDHDYDDDDDDVSTGLDHHLPEALFEDLQLPPELQHFGGIQWAPADDFTQMAFHHQQNLGFCDYHRVWNTYIGRRQTPSAHEPEPEFIYIDEFLEEFERARRSFVTYDDLKAEECDIQGVNWKRMAISRSTSRRRREGLYNNYTNVLDHRSLPVQPPLDDTENFFRFRRLDLTQRPAHIHFQLRNLIACTSRNSVYYAARSQVVQSCPLFNTSDVAMDLTDPEITPARMNDDDWGMSISTIAAGHGFLIAGGFGGEYALTRITAGKYEHVMGQVTEDPNGITNHVQITENRRSHAPQAIFSNNDKAIRVLDIGTQKVTQTFKLDWAINCSAISTDARLRVAVGDSTTVLILNEETGDVLQELGGSQGHKDFGFSAAWADNGFHVATGNQDKMVKIWDARMWTRHGRAEPLANIPSHLAGVRALEYSPIGSGKRVLVAAEQADVISIIDAELYETKQHFDFFGEILGTSFTPDGQGLFVGISDEHLGGIMEFEKCGFGQSYQGPRISKYDTRDTDTRAKIGPGEYFVRGDDGKLHDAYYNGRSDVRRRAMEVGEDWAPTADDSASRAVVGKPGIWRTRKIATG